MQHDTKDTTTTAMFSNFCGTGDGHLTDDNILVAKKKVANHDITKMSL